MLILPSRADVHFSATKTRKTGRRHVLDCGFSRVNRRQILAPLAFLSNHAGWFVHQDRLATVSAPVQNRLPQPLPHNGHQSRPSRPGQQRSWLPYCLQSAGGRSPASTSAFLIHPYRVVKGTPKTFEIWATSTPAHPTLTTGKGPPIGGRRTITWLRSSRLDYASGRRMASVLCLQRGLLRGC